MISSKRNLIPIDYETMQMPLGFRDVVWSEFKPIHEAINLEGYLRRLSVAFGDGDGLFIMGPPSSGKSRLSAMVAKLARQYCFSVEWVDAFSLQESINKSLEYDDGDSIYPIIRRYERVECLVIDDLGSEKTAVKFDLNHIIEVLKKRLDWNRPTIINTNLTDKELDARYGVSLMKKLLIASFPVTLPPKPKDHNPAIEKYGDKSGH